MHPQGILTKNLDYRSGTSCSLIEGPAGARRPGSGLAAGDFPGEGLLGALPVPPRRTSSLGRPLKEQAPIHGAVRR